MEIELSYFNEVDSSYDSLQDHFLGLANLVFKHLSLDDFFILELTLCDNNKIQELNKEYRKIDRPTDVLSFEYGYKDELKIKDMPKFLGEIYISIDKTIEQAKLYKHSFLREISFLFVHGLLHLLGYDHMKKEDEEVMFKIQDEILDPLNL